MSTESKTCERFKTNLVTLLDIIIDMFEEAKDHSIDSLEPSIIEVLKIIVKNFSGERMLKNFINRTNEYWDKILEEDLEYFKTLGLQLFDFTKEKGVDSLKKEYESNAFFNVLKDSHIDTFKSVLAASYMEDGEEIEIFDAERREDIWKIMKSFVRMSILYVHDGRCQVDGKYTKECFPSIKIKENAKKWQIKSIAC